MGSGGAKKHQSFTITPATAVALTAPATPDAAPAGPAGPATVEPGSPAEPLPITAPSASVAAPDVSAGAEADGAAATADDTARGIEILAAAQAATVVDAGATPPGDDVPLTPVPETLPVGDPLGVPLLAGGADLEDSLLTLTSYAGAADGPSREVLRAQVTDEAEEKLLAALATGAPLVPVEVDKEIHGRLPADTDQQVYERLLKVAKSVNYHLQKGDGFPTHTITGAEKLTTEMSDLQDSGAAADKKMAAHYLAHLAAVQDRISGTVTAPYTQGGMLPFVTPYEVQATVTVTEMVPDPTAVPPGLLPTNPRPATRIAATLEPDGTARWDGQARTSTAGTEYAIDLGDGYTAVYRPHTPTGKADKQVPYSYRGNLEITAPAGAGHASELVDRLGQLNLVNRPLTADEGEWAYLTRQVTAQNLSSTPQVRSALRTAAGLDDAMEHLVLAERASAAAGLDDAGLHRFAARIRVEAEARALPARVRLLRDAVAHSTGHADGAALAAAPGYDPRPRPSGGWLTWSRFDVAANVHAVRTAFGDRGLVHRVTGHNLLPLLRTGALASTERRSSMGLASGLGMSEQSDQNSGGARSVFLRVAAAPSSGPALFWDDPSVLLTRADWYAYNGDHFGALNPSGSHSTTGMTRDPGKVASFTSASNEVMIGNGIDLFGAEAPSRIVCSNASQRAEVLDLLASRGVSQLRGRPVQEAVTT